MDMRDQDKEIEMPVTLGYNLPNRDSSSSKLPSPILASTVGETSDHRPAQTHTVILSDPPQTSHHHHLYPPSALPPNPLQLQQPHRSRRDPDPSSYSSPIATTSITSTPIVGGSSNPPRTATPPPQQPQTTGISTTISTPLIRYRECLKNHAASMGGHVIDGCGEFMPSGEEGTPESMTCAACECHRNFHRKEAEGEPQHVFNYQSYYPNISNGQNWTHSPHHHHHPTHLQFPTPPSSLHQHHRFSSHGGATAPSPRVIQPMMMAFGGSSGGPAESSSEDLNMFQSNDDGGQLSVQPLPLSKKRIRTKFTQQQKDRMMEFAEKLGWKIQKQDEQEVHQFCSHVGVKRQVFKVWMHNNKQAMKKKQMANSEGRRS